MQQQMHARTHGHTHNRLTALCPGVPEQRATITVIFTLQLLVHCSISHKSATVSMETKRSKLTDPNDNLAPVADVSLVPKVGPAGSRP